MRDGRVVEGLQLLSGLTLEADRAAVGVSGRLAVDRLADSEGAAVVAVEQARLAGPVHVAHSLSRAQHAEHGVIKALGPFNVVGANHHVVQHV